MIVDIHAHHVPPSFLDMLERDPGRWGVELSRDDGGRRRVAIAGRADSRPLAADVLDLDRRVAAMAAAGVDVQVLSCWAGLTNYAIAPRVAADYARRFNEALAETAAAAPERFRALAIVPLQAPERAAAELEHAVTRLGMGGVEILTRVGEAELDDAALDPFWRRAADVDCLVLIHPHDSLGGRRLDRYRLDNLVGNPAETTIALAHLVLGGVLERHPALRICVVHAGGYLPYGAGRLDRGYRADPELVARRLSRAPSEWLRCLHYDTIGHSLDALRFLADFAGASRMLLGSDHPFVMGDPAPVSTVRAIPGLSEDERAAVLGGNALRLLG